ncbi:MAG TPA: hypothetical protein VFM54_08820 [Micromonosporaceae bacterium]|nr:hypothetical protein [Micromonosporaceae bacterium]
MTAQADRGRSRWWWLAGLCGAVAFGGLLVFLGLAPDPWLERFDKLSSVGGLIVAVVGLAVSVWSVTRASRAPAAEPAALLEQAASGLAVQVRRQWRAELDARGMGHLDPIRLRWSATDRPVMPSPAEVIGADRLPLPPARVTRLRLAGDVDEMTRALTRLPSRQLVIIGAPGAGKSTLAVLVTLGLLDQWQAGDPVPVLLTLTSWDPSMHLSTWLAWRLAEAYPGLRNPSRYGASAPARLVEAGLVLPVLDGLDEMPVPLHARAVTALTAAVGRDRPLVLTSRAEEYQSAVRQAGEPLARAAVVEIEPVTAADAADYLTAGQVDGRARWRPVLAQLAAAPDGALARALRTPLMVYLARVAYRVPDPAGLLSFTDPDAIAAHLLDAYLPAVYAGRTPRPPPPDTAGHPDRTPARGYPPQQAQRWLTFLAAHLTEEGSTDLAWWRLYRAMPNFQLQAGLAYALGAGTLLGLGFGLTFGLRLDAAAGVTFGLVAGLGGGLGGGLMVGFASDRVYAVPQQRRASAGWLGTGVAVGFTLGFLSWLFLATGLMAGVVFGSTVGLLLGLMAGLGEPATLTRAVTPASTLRNDRNVSSLYGLVLGLAAALLTWLAFGPEPGLLLGLAAALTFGLLMSAVAGAWPHFLVARVLLAARRRLPYDLMGFLDDAYRRGVLRQVGAVYQFRHARLQQHLAVAHAGATTTSRD